MHIIAKIHTDFPEKFGLPRQSGLIGSLKGKIVFEKEYRNEDALRGLEGFSHLWILWKFDGMGEREWSPTVRPPRLGGNRRMGVFATRSPNRPNPIAMSAVKIEEIRKDGENGTVIIVSGIDMKDGTGVFDIKPYLPYADSIPGADGGFADAGDEVKRSVRFEDGASGVLPEERERELEQILSRRPVPAYKNDEARVYHLSYAGYEIDFKEDGEVIVVLDIR